MNTGSVSDEVSVGYVWWQEKAADLIEPIVELMEEGRSSISFAGGASDHGKNADRLESFARPFALWAHWRYSLDASPNEEQWQLNQKAESWFKSALLAGTNPDSEEFWGYSSSFHQHSVEIGLLVIGLEICRGQFWEGFSSDEKTRVLEWLESDAGNGHHWNNHMFFGILALEFLMREGRGRPSYRAVVDRWFHELEGMYESDGWYMDGSNQTFDFYNAYAFHYYALWWVRFYGESNPSRSELWMSRTRLFLENYPAFFASSGEHPAFGRSIAYRFNTTAPFGLAHLSGCSPVPAGMARSLCSRNLAFFLDKDIRQSQGCLSIGWYDAFNGFAETYSCGASPYWAAKAFAPLIIPPEDSFWSEPEQLCPAAQADGTLALKGPSLVIRNTGGEVELVNVGVQIGCGNRRFGPHKWGRLSYKTSFGFTVPQNEDLYPLDGGLTAEVDGRGEIYGRHYTAPVAVSESHAACLYSLGGKVDQSQMSVETYMWWRGDWQLTLHSIRSKSSAMLRFGGYALASYEASALTLSGEGASASVGLGKRGVRVQGIVGYDAFEFDRRLDDSEPRRHIQAPYHATPILRRRIEAGEDLILASVMWAGEGDGVSLDWDLDSLSAGVWKLSHQDLGEWTVVHDILPAVQPAKEE